MVSTLLQCCIVIVMKIKLTFVVVVVVVVVVIAEQNVWESVVNLYS